MATSMAYGHGKDGDAGISIRRGDGFAWQMPFCRKDLSAVLEAMRKAAGIADIPLEVLLTGDASISATNATYLGCTGPTNILAFPPYAGFGPGLGSGVPGTGLLILSLDALTREALLYGQNKSEHALRLLAHGMAHLAGYDHGGEMDALTNQVFTCGWRAWNILGQGKRTDEL